MLECCWVMKSAEREENSTISIVYRYWYFLSKSPPSLFPLFPFLLFLKVKNIYSVQQSNTGENKLTISQPFSKIVRQGVNRCAPLVNQLIINQTQSVKVTNSTVRWSKNGKPSIQPWHFNVEEDCFEYTSWDSTLYETIKHKFLHKI